MPERHTDAAAVPVPDAAGTWGGIDHTAVKVLTVHQRRDIGSCLCGWGVGTGDLGHSHALHIWRQLQAAGVDRRMVPDPGEDTLRERLAEALRPLGVPYGDGTSRVHMASAVDALLPLIREHTAGLAFGMQSWRERAEEAEAAIERERPPTQYAYDQACKALHKHRERADNAEAEVERLTDWKESAMTVMSGLQELGTELGLPLGEPITGTLAAETAHRLRTRAETAEAAIEQVRDLASDDADLRSGVVGMVRVSDIRRTLDRTESTHG